MSTILLVEDNPHIMKINAEVLSLHGYEVLRAGTAAEAREQLRWHPANLIVLDIMLPDGNGIELCRELKGLLSYPDSFSYGTWGKPGGRGGASRRRRRLSA